MSTFATPVAGSAPNQYVSVNAFDAAVRAAIEIEASARMTADLAIVAAGSTIYATVSDGLAATASGGTFCVAASGGVGIDVYRENAGSAVLLTTLTPDVPAVEAAVASALGDALRAETARDQAQIAADNAQASAFTCATWAVLSTLTGSTAGQGAEVLDADTGTHTDPVAGGTVSNAGRYTWSASPAGWRRIGGTGLSAKAAADTVAAKKSLYASQAAPNLIPPGAAQWRASAAATDLSDTVSGGIPAISLSGPASSGVNAAFDVLRDADATDVTFSVRLMSKTGGSASYPGRLIIYQVDEAYGTGTSGATVLASTVALFPGGDVATETDVSATATLNASTSRLVLVVDLQSATNAVFSLATAGWGAVTGYRLPENRPDDVLTDLQWPLVQSMARRRWVGAIRADTDAISTGTRWFIDGTDLTISVAENAIRMFDSGEDINDIGAWEVDTSYTATSTSASSAGAVISLGAGADRRHYVYLRNGYVGVLNNSNAALDGAVSAATYDLSEQVGLRLFRRPDGTGYIEATGPDGTKTRRDVANIPTGRVYAASRANATCKIHHLTIVPAACAVADVDQRVTALETLAGLAATVPLGFTVLPNYPAARDTATNGFGFTCTGLDRFPTDTTFAGCWLVGDDGRMIEGDGTPLAGAAHILSPDKRTILRSFAFGEVSSVQGVACVDDDTFWVALSTLKEIRHYNIGGTLLATLEWDTLGYTGDPNGLAWDSANSGLWVTTAASATARLLLASDGTLLDTVTLATTTPDQLHYDSANGLLYATTGSNGTPGTVHVHRVSTDTAVGSYASLRHAEAIEGIYLDRETATLTLTNDGQYHNIARPALNCLPEYRVSLFT